MAARGRISATLLSAAPSAPFAYVFVRRLLTDERGDISLNSLKNLPASTWWQCKRANERGSANRLRTRW